MNFRSSLAVLLSSALTACATGKSASSGQSAAQPQPQPQPAAAPAAEAAPASAPGAPAVDLAGLAAREVGEMAKKPIAFPEGRYRGEIESSGEPVAVASVEAVSLRVPIGTESEMVCYVYPQPLDAGATMQRLVGLFGDGVEVKAIRPTDIVAVQENPALFAEFDYVVQSEKGMLAGRAKAMVFAHPAHPVMCLHDEFGYRAAFQRIALGFAGSLHDSFEAPPARFAELQIKRINGQPSGFSRVVVRDREDGAQIFESVGAVLYSKSVNELVVEDLVKTALSDSEGRVSVLSFARLRNGELDTQLQLQRGTDGAYRYEGLRGSEKLSGSFNAKDALGLPSDSLIARQVRDQLLAGKAKRLTVEIYSPMSSPGATVEVVVSKGEEGPGDLRMAIGGVESRARADERGVVERTEAKVGRANLVEERVYSRGAL